MRIPEKKTIGELLNSQLRFVIPDYQRAYDWKADTQLKDLFLDLFGAIEEGNESELFLGTMIFDYSKDKTFADNKSIDIIDGQQRFTTIMILLVAFREYAKNVLDSSKIVTMSQRAIDAGDEMNIDAQPQLIPSESIRDVFDNICDEDWDGEFPETLNGKGVIYQNRRVQPIYNACMSEIRTFASDASEERLRELWNQIQHNTIIITIGIDEQSEAFEIFERTNARGKDLAVEDLLKNLLFSRDAQAEISTREAWNEVSDNAGSSMLRMLKYFWNARGGTTSTKALYRNLKQYHSRMSTDKFVHELLEFSEFYKAYSSKDSADIKKWFKSVMGIKDSMYLQEVCRTIGALKMFKVTQVIPLIFSIAKSLSGKGQDAKLVKKMITFFRLVEAYHYVNNKICNRVGNEVEKLYQKSSKDIFTSKNPMNDVASLSKILIEKLAQEDEFIAKFKNISYSQPNERHLIKYTFDKLVNTGAKPGQRKDLIVFDEVFQGLKPSFDIEHLLSQSYGSDQDEHIHELGNLLIIPRQINGILGNATILEKVEMLLEPKNYNNNIHHVDDYIKNLCDEISQLGQWGENEIKSRTLKLARDSYSSAVNKYKY